MQCFFGIRRPARGAGQGLTALHMTKNFRNQRRILDSGDDPELAAAFRAGFDVDGEYPPEALHPAHRRGGSVVVYCAARPVRNNAGAVFAVRRKEAVEAGEIQSGAWHQGSQPGDGRSCASMRPRHTVHPEHKVQRLQDDVG